MAPITTNKGPPPAKRQKLVKYAYLAPRVDAAQDFTGEDLWNKMPAEVRNAIYELVAIDEEDRPYAIRYRPNVQAAPVITRHVWRDGKQKAIMGSRTFFNVNKQIRLEFGSIWFSIHKFTLSVATIDIPKACDWLISLTKEYKVTDFGCFELELDQRPLWREVPNFNVFANLLRETRLTQPVVAHKYRDFTQGTRFWIGAKPTDVNIIHALNQALALGISARENGQTREQVNEAWAKAFEEISRSKPYRKSLTVRKKASAEASKDQQVVKGK